MIRMENLASEAFRENTLEEKACAQRFLDSFIDDIIVKKSGGNNDTNTGNEKADNKASRHEIGKKDSNKRKF